ncbi:MAG: hypothetical protein CL607_16520 [Anaerolineaceae bacterium]|nr:hypothetical protein [Anaerolineaceae bacterium]
MPLTDDGNLHLYRVIALDHSMAFDGALWPRYSSILALGYGAPLFNFFPPTTYYLPRLLHVLGLPFVQAFLASMALYTYIAAWGAFLLGRSWSNNAGGFITAAAYVYAPYWLFNTITRGTLSEVAGLAILPFTLWILHKLTKNHNRRLFVAATLITAVFIVIHNIVTLHGAILLAAYSLFLALRSNQSLKTLGMLAEVGVLSVAISAFFWLPALSETHYTHITGTTEALSFIDPVRTLRPLADVLAFPKTADPTLFNPQVPITLGWPQLILGSISVLLAIKWRQRRGLVIFALLVVSGSVFLNLEQSAPLWQTLPLIGYSQFAWRILGVASLVLSLMAGVAIGQITNRLHSKWLVNGVLALSLGLIILLSLPWLYTPYIEVEANSFVDVLNYENQRRELSLSSYSEYLPARTEGAALNGTENIAKFQVNPVISRLDLPETIEVIRVSWQSLSVEFDLDASQSTQLDFQWLYIPGWTALLDDQPLEIEPTSPEGFLRVTVPEGRHTLQIALQSTQQQTIAVIISITGFVLLAAMAFMWKSSTEAEAIETLSQPASTASIIITVIITSLGVFMIKATVLDHTQNVFRSERFNAQAESPSINRLNASFNEEITLLGISTPEIAQSGEIASFELFWQLISNRLDHNYMSFIQLIDSDSNIVLQTEPHPPGNRETSNWIPDLYVSDAINFDIPADTPPASYDVQVGLYDVETGNRLNIHNAEGNIAGDMLLIGTIILTRPEETTEATQNTLYEASNLSLRIITGIQNQATVGNEINLNWQWQTHAQPNQNYRARLAWLDEYDQPVAYSGSAPMTPGYPTSQWQAGDIWTGHARLYVPGSLPSGDYSVGIQLLEANGEAVTAPHIIQTMSVQEPERILSEPRFATASNAHWINGLTLRGYSISKESQTIALVWQTTDRLDTSLRLFVQVFDDSALLAVSDGIPVDYTRPTTSWSTQEYITTHHTFELPLSDYQLHIGWYDPLTNERILLENGSDTLLISP